MAHPLGNPRPLATQPIHTPQHEAPALTRDMDKGHLLLQFPRLPGPTTPPCMLGEAGKRRKKIPESLIRRVPLLQALNSAHRLSETHTRTRSAQKCFDRLATGKSTEGKRAKAKSSEELFSRKGQLCKLSPQSASLF